jgi:hypothetical protein
MTENANDQPTLVFSIGTSDATLSAARIGKVIPDAYRLVRFRTEEGQVHLKLQGYFTWTQGWLERGGEWRDIETVDADDFSDDKPYGHLY